MSTIFGAIGIADSDRVFASTVGASVILDVVNSYVEQYNNSINAAMAVFVEKTTSDHTARYKLPGGGRMTERNVRSRGAAVKATGGWDVAYALRDFDEKLAGNDVDLAYMSAAEFQRHLQSIMIRHTNQVRYMMLHRLLDNVAETFVDPLQGSLTIQPLANGDTVVYPPVIGAESEATDDHYLESGYLAAAISDTNNPFVTIRDEIEEHFGTMTGGENIVTFVNNAQRAQIEDLADFDEVPDRFIRLGNNADVPVGLPSVPGRILGRVSGCWAVEWRFIPANYMLSVHMEEAPPLVRRVDPADTGLPTELTLISDDSDYPWEIAEFRHRFGFGVGNRLNGVVMELGNGGTYTVPTAYD